MESSGSGAGGKELQWISISLAGSWSRWRAPGWIPWRVIVLINLIFNTEYWLEPEEVWVAVFTQLVQHKPISNLRKRQHSLKCKHQLSQSFADMDECNIGPNGHIIINWFTPGPWPTHIGGIFLHPCHICAGSERKIFFSLYQHFWISPICRWGWIGFSQRRLWTIWRTLRRLRRAPEKRTRTRQQGRSFRWLYSASKGFTSQSFHVKHLYLSEDAETIMELSLSRCSHIGNCARHLKVSPNWHQEAPLLEKRCTWGCWGWRPCGFSPPPCWRCSKPQSRIHTLRGKH